MADWKIGEYRVEEQRFEGWRPECETCGKRFGKMTCCKVREAALAEKWDRLNIKPMSWEAWKAEADQLGYFVREEFHTGSGIYEALDPQTKAQTGEWNGTLGYFQSSSGDECIHCHEQIDVRTDDHNGTTGRSDHFVKPISSR